MHSVHFLFSGAHGITYMAGTHHTFAELYANYITIAFSTL